MLLEPVGDGTYRAGPPAFGIYNRRGELVIPPEYDRIVLLTGNIFRVERGEAVGYRDQDGEWVWELGR